jgi:hypothetical protein
METKEKKVYLSNLKTIGQTQGLKGRIYEDKIEDHWETDDKGRRYIQYAIWPNREPDQYGNSHAMLKDTWKPEPKQEQQPAKGKAKADKNDLPF